MNYLVTGGAGFIGSHITERLLADGHAVRILDNFSTGKRENIPVSPAVEVIEGDVGDLETVRQAMHGVDYVFHEAAIASVPETVGNPLASERVNYRGTLNILETARHAGVKRVVFACSAAVYGDLPELPKREDMPLRPLSPYAIDKLASEHACQVYTHLYGLEAVALRYFNVFGPRQDPSSPYSGVISIFSDHLPTTSGRGSSRPSTAMASRRGISCLSPMSLRPTSVRQPRPRQRAGPSISPPAAPSPSTTCCAPSAAIRAPLPARQAGRYPPLARRHQPGAGTARLETRG